MFALGILSWTFKLNFDPNILFGIVLATFFKNWAFFSNHPVPLIALIIMAIKISYYSG
jgi:hypothetical protein